MVYDIVESMRARPYELNMGAGKLAKRYKTSRENIYKAKDIIRGVVVDSGPKILIFDIEITPLEAYIWATNVWKARVPDESVISRWFMLTWSAKWLNDNQIMSMRGTREEVLEEDDGRIVKGLWELLNQADIVVAHNGNKFDVPNINTRFVVHGLPPTKPYKQIDTLKIAQSQFGFSHNSLDALCNVFGFGAKNPTGMALWKRAKSGDNDALEYMEEYNRNDVVMLEKLYLKLRPWIRNHPNVGMYKNTLESVCANCGSSNIVVDGHYYTNTGRYLTYKCNDCGGAVSRERKSDLSKDKREKLLVSINR